MDQFLILHLVSNYSSTICSLLHLCQKPADHVCRSISVCYVPSHTGFVQLAEGTDPFKQRTNEWMNGAPRYEVSCPKVKEQTWRSRKAGALFHIYVKEEISKRWCLTYSGLLGVDIRTVVVSHGSERKLTTRGCGGAVGVWEQGCYVHATVKKDAINSSQTSPGASLLCVPPGVSLIPVTETFAHFFLFFSILTGLLEGRSHTSFRYGTKYSAGNKTYTTVQEGRVGWVLPPQTLMALVMWVPFQEWLQVAQSGEGTDDRLLRLRAQYPLLWNLNFTAYTYPVGQIAFHLPLLHIKYRYTWFFKKNHKKTKQNKTEPRKKGILSQRAL